MSAYASDWNANMAKIAAAKFRINAHGWLDVTAVLGTEYIFKPHHFILQKKHSNDERPYYTKNRIYATVSFEFIQTSTIFNIIFLDLK